MRPQLILVFLALGFVPLQAQAPRGWRTFDHTRTGLRWYYPKEFEITPVQPTEKLILAKFERPEPYRARSGESRKAESFIVFRLPQAPVEGADQAATDDGKPKSYEEAMERQNSIHDWQKFMKSRFRGLGWETIKGDVDDGGQEFRLRARDDYVGFLFVKQSEGETYGVVGFCDDVVAKQFGVNFANVGRSIHAPEGYKAVKEIDEGFYAGKDYRDIPFRVKARRAMVKGWKALDTDNFFVVYHTDNEKLVRKIVNDLEAVRPHYEALLPPTKEIEAVSVVRVCESPDEYFNYGGPERSAGYWNFVAKELVLYDAKGAEEKRSAADSFVVLYHEAFHQYVFHALDQLAPDYWFNEGMADYFAGAEFYRHSDKLKGIGLNRWRIALVKKLVDHKAFIGLEPLINAKRAQFYDQRVAGVMYAEAWSLAFFLLRSRETDARPEWRAIIPNYFAALKEESAKLRKLQTADATLEERNATDDKIRAAAMATAWKGIDLKELETVWKDWIRATKDPWAAQR